MFVYTGKSLSSERRADCFLMTKIPALFI